MGYPVIFGRPLAPHPGWRTRADFPPRYEAPGLPYPTGCHRCGGPCGLWLVEDWLWRLAPACWRRELLCLDCFRSLVGAGPWNP